MNYKRLEQQNLNEVVFAAFLPTHGKGQCISQLVANWLLTGHWPVVLVITLCRAFTTRQDAEGYKALFQKVFEIMAKHTRKSVCFSYLHGSGFESITMDMDEGQMHGKKCCIGLWLVTVILTCRQPGLGQYLVDVDPEHRPVKWQIQHIMILCRVHYLRGIENVIGPKKRQTTIFKTMVALLNCQSRWQYYQVIQLLQGEWFLLVIGQLLTRERKWKWSYCSLGKS